MSHKSHEFRISLFTQDTYNVFDQGTSAQPMAKDENLSIFLQFDHDTEWKTFFYHVDEVDSVLISNIHFEFNI